MVARSSDTVQPRLTEKPAFFGIFTLILRFMLIFGLMGVFDINQKHQTLKIGLINIKMLRHFPVGVVHYKPHHTKLCNVFAA